MSSAIEPRRSGATDPIVRPLAIALDHPGFDGHFPGDPLLPGVALLAAVLEIARVEPQLDACVGVAPRLTVSKFLGEVRPGAELVVEFRVHARTLDWRVDAAGSAVASGQIARADESREGTAP